MVIELDEAAVKSAVAQCAEQELLENIMKGQIGRCDVMVDVTSHDACLVDKSEKLFCHIVNLV